MRPRTPSWDTAQVASTPSGTPGGGEAETLARFHEALRRSGTIISEVDRDLRYTWVYDPSAPTPARNLIGQRVDEADPSPQGHQYAALQAGVISTGTPVRQEIPLCRAGKVQWYDVRLEPRRGADGAIAGLISVALDITARHDAEESLRKSEQLYRAIGETINYGIWVCDPNGRNIYASPSLLKLVGMTQEECSEFGWGNYLHPDEAEATIAAWKECTATGSFWERLHRYRGVDGTYHHVLARGVPIRDAQGTIVCWAGINLDMDERVRMEEDLRRTRDRLERTLNAIADAFITLDSDFRITYVNAEAARINRKRPEEFLGKTHWDEWPASVGTQVEWNYRKAMTEKVPVHFEHRYYIEGQYDVWLDIHVYPLEDGLAVYYHDITARKQTEEHLRAAGERLRFHIENSPLAVVEWDNNFIVTLWSGEAERMFGFTSAEVLGRPIGELQLIHDQDVPVVLRTMERLSSGREKTVVSENRNITKDGRTITCVWYNSVLVDQAGAMASVMSLVQDVTEERQARESLERTVATLGTVVSHSPESILLIDEDGTIRFVSPAATTVLGAPREELEGSDVMRLLPQDQLLYARFHFASLVRSPSESVTATLRLHTKDGPDAWFLLKASIVQIGSARGYLVYPERGPEH